MVRTSVTAILVMCCLSAQAPADDVSAGGATTQDAANRQAFSLPAANLPDNRIREFFRGNRLFNTHWQKAPGNPAILDGLGPTYNQPVCGGCHVDDGRGRPPEKPGDAPDQMIFRLSVPGADAEGRPLPHPVYGSQIQHWAIEGVPAEARIVVETVRVEGTYGDGTPFALRKPVYRFRDLAFGPLGENTMISPRVAPAVFGSGLLEAVPEAVIAEWADPLDANGDGISGRPNRVYDELSKRTRLGRFGWKAGQPGIRQQNALALLEDIGITSSLFPAGNCPPAQVQCRAAPDGGSPEADDAVLEILDRYMESIAVPARRNRKDPQVQRGETLFSDVGCAACHRPALSSGAHVNPVVADQVFAPYTDLLLHDMGDGLADGRPEFLATGREWRTPPLWGLGLIPIVNGHQRLMHDGRADGPAEAILWHGGEAAPARERFRTLPESDRSALLAFLNSL